MIPYFSENSPALERALHALEQAKARYDAERKKQNEKRRKAENHHKYMMGGIIVKYFPDCYQYEQNELENILSSALRSQQFWDALEMVQNARNSKSGQTSAAMADEKEEGQNGSGNRRDKVRDHDGDPVRMDETGGGYADMGGFEWENEYEEEQ